MAIVTMLGRGEGGLDIALNLHEKLCVHPTTRILQSCEIYQDSGNLVLVIPHIGAILSGHEKEKK